VVSCFINVYLKQASSYVNDGLTFYWAIVSSDVVLLPCDLNDAFHVSYGITANISPPIPFGTFPLELFGIKAGSKLLLSFSGGSLVIILDGVVFTRV
jgi:hypothetical protein